MSEIERFDVLVFGNSWRSFLLKVPRSRWRFPRQARGLWQFIPATTPVARVAQPRPGRAACRRFSRFLK